MDLIYHHLSRKNAKYSLLPATEMWGFALVYILINVICCFGLLGGRDKQIESVTKAIFPQISDILYN